MKDNPTDHRQAYIDQIEFWSGEKLLDQLLAISRQREGNSIHDREVEDDMISILRAEITKRMNE